MRRSLWQRRVICRRFELSLVQNAEEWRPRGLMPVAGESRQKIGDRVDHGQVELDPAPSGSAIKPLIRNSRPQRDGLNAANNHSRLGRELKPVQTGRSVK